MHMEVERGRGLFGLAPFPGHSDLDALLGLGNWTLCDRFRLSSKDTRGLAASNRGETMTVEVEAVEFEEPTDDVDCRLLDRFFAFSDETEG